jgi:hypothetical protein
VVGVQINGFTFIELIDPQTHRVIQRQFGFFPGGVSEPAGLVGRLGPHAEARTVFFGPDGQVTPLAVLGQPPVGSNTLSLFALGPDIGVLGTLTTLPLRTNHRLDLFFTTLSGFAPGGPALDFFVHPFVFLGSS